MEGVVKDYSRRRGLGFITTDGGEDVFVHHSELVEVDRRYLTPGQRVRFQVQKSERGPRAVKVEVIAEVPLAKERHLDWRGPRHGPPRPGGVPETALRARGIVPADDEEDEQESEE